ncbi:hypothetical protein GGR57DRAFT_459082 [Xylariaceae sp. FL1272]|nr:hypothetical protein GGR57DRAFT_459082 [Xylariaceae sp. FL1272]
MMARVANYVPVSQKGPDEVEEDNSFAIAQPTYLRKARTSVVFFIGATLLASLCANLFFIYRQFVTPWSLLEELPTRFAGLRRNIPTEILSSSNFDSMNRTVQDTAWNNVDMEPWNGFLALDEHYAIDRDLPHSQRWPWDHSKGVYIMTSSHELHCVRVLRQSVNEDNDGVSQGMRTWEYPHLMHCLNVLRESVVCNADDTPLYIGRLHKNAHEQSPRAGTGTMKMCRDWNSLLKWSRARSACYRPVHWAEKGFSELDRYKSCPDGAKPWERVDNSLN